MNCKIICAYDGTRYQGWQKNKNAKETIESKLETHISELLGETVEIHGSGRTDKGAHATHQVVSFKTKQRVESKWYHKLNQVLPEDIVVKSLEKVDARFHARLSAKEKTYEYTLWKTDCQELPLFERKYVYHLTGDVLKHFDGKWHLSMEAMTEAAELFVGKHDFKGFSSDKTKKSTERIINEVAITEDENKIVFKVSGNGFLYNMVRIMVGTLVEIGAGARQAASITKVFEGKDRAGAGYTVPAKGLCLVNVSYE